MFSFVKNRPPLIIFFVCLLTVAVTKFCFAFYIKNTDPVPDSDRNHDWLTLLRHFNSLNTCFELNHNVSKEVQGGDFIEMSTVQALVSINNSENIRKFTNVKGFLTLGDWHPNCPKRYEKPSRLEIFFEIPDSVNDTVTHFDVCVSIRGPEEYLPKFLEPNCKASSRSDEKKVEAFLSTSTIPKTDDFCKNGLITSLKFHPQRKSNFANFLNENEKSFIYVHLLWTSYFLVFILVIIAIYAVFQSERVVDKYFVHK